MKNTPFEEIINRFESQLKDGQIENATNQIHHISSRLNPKLFHSQQTNIVQIFVEIMPHILPVTVHYDDNLKIRAVKFLNHWFCIMASFLPKEYFIMVKLLYDKGYGKFMETAIPPLVDIFRYEKKKNRPDTAMLLYNLINEMNFDNIETIPENTWSIIKDNVDEENVFDMIKLFLNREINENGVAIMAMKNSKRFLEYIFQAGSLKFIDKCLKNIPSDLEYDILPLSARVSDALFLDGGNLTVAYDIVPMIVKPIKNDIQEATYRPFWTSARNYLNQRNSTTCLYALYSGYKNKLVTKETMISFLKLDSNIEQRYRLASFKIGVDFFDEPDFQPKMLDIIREVSMTRNNPILCCLVDNLPLLYDKIYNIDKHIAITVVNSIMNPIPIDDFLPIFVLKFLNFLDLNEPDFNFDVKEIIYKYMGILNDEIVPEMKKLINKIGLIIDFKKVDWFDLSILLSLNIVEDVDPAFIHELLIFEYIHISLIPLAIDLITKSGDATYFDFAFGTLVRVFKKFGFNTNSELEKRGLRSIKYEYTWIDDSVLSHSFHKTSVLLPNSNLGKVAISIANYIIAVVNKAQPSTKVLTALMLISRFLLYIDPDVAISLFMAVKVDEKKLLKEFHDDILKQAKYVKPVPFITLMLSLRGHTRTILLAKPQVLKAISIDYNLAKRFASYLDQPLDVMPTYEAFEGVEQHKEWIEKCKNEIPEADKITPKDEQFVDEEVKETHFEFHPVTPDNIEKGIEQIGNGYKYDLIQFLYFSDISKKELPIPITEVEQFIIDHPSDIRLIIGFFFYAYNHGYHTKRAEEWTKIIHFNRDEVPLYAASLFLSTLTGIKLSSLPVYMTTFLLNGLRSIGYFMLTKKNLILAFRTETEVKWFFIRSIINLDIDYFSDDSLIVAEFSKLEKQSSVFKSFFNKLPVQDNIDLLMATFISLTHVYFTPTMIVHIRPYPLVHHCLYNLKYIGGIPPTIRIEDSFINSLLSMLEKQPFFPIVFFTFFAYLKLSDSQFQRVHDLLDPHTSDSGSFFRYVVPAAYFNLPDVKMVIDERAAIQFSNRPPSYSRAFYRSLMLPFTPMLPQKLIVEIYDLLCPVFPPFSYNALNTWSTMNNFDKIIYQKYPANALEKFKIVSRETVDIYRKTMCDPLYKKRKDITREVVKAAFSAQSNPRFALDIVKAILSMGHGTGFKDLLHEAKIVNMPNFLCFCLVFKHADEFLKIPNLKNEVSDLISDPQKKEIFLNLHDPKNIELLIHPKAE